MHIAIVGPVFTADIGRLLGVHAAGLPEGCPGAPLLTTLIEELLRRGHRVTVVTLSWGMTLDWQQPVRAQHNNLEVVYAPMRRRAWRPNGWLPGRIVDLYAFERRGMRQAILDAAPDVVHAHWSYEFAWAAQSTGLPVVITCHDSPLLVARMSLLARPTRSLYRWLKAGMAWHVLRRAQCITAVSPYLQQAVSSLCKRTVFVVPNPLPPVVCDDSIVRTRQLDPDAPIIAMVANGWDKRKNPQPALRAFASLRTTQPAAQLRLYGTDFGSGEVAECWAHQHGIAEGMQFVGRLPYREVLEQVASADMLVHPSLEETFGMSIVEAMAMGVPVIGGMHSGAVPWVVGQGGILLDVRSAAAIEQAMRSLITSPEHYQAVAMTALSRAREHFTVGKVVDAYELIYGRVVG